MNAQGHSSRNPVPQCTAPKRTCVLVRTMSSSRMYRSVIDSTVESPSRPCRVSSRWPLSKRWLDCRLASVTPCTTYGLVKGTRSHPTECTSKRCAAHWAAGAWALGAAGTEDTISVGQTCCRVGGRGQTTKVELVGRLVSHI